MSITCKFGGSSLADAGQVLKVINIIESRPSRRHIVVSAPGKRSPSDIKVTDLFIAWQAAANVDVSAREIRNKIEDRYLDIVRELGLGLDLSPDFNEIDRQLSQGAGKDYAASRGEYLMGKVLAKPLKFGFVDPLCCIRINKDGLANSFVTYDLTVQAVGRAGGRCVMPGFYGGALDGKTVKTFSRGGSDISGAILAKAVGAERYENWTDVSGMLAADPGVIKNPRRIPQLSYKEAWELASMGFGVIHAEALYPVYYSKIPTHILNTNAPETGGTEIVHDSLLSQRSGCGEIVGIAGRKNFTVFHLEQALMKFTIGFGRKVLEVLENHGVGYEVAPDSPSSMSVIVHQSQLENGKLDLICLDLREISENVEFEVYPDTALITCVGNGMVHTTGIAARLFKAFAAAGVSNHTISQPVSERSITVGIANDDYEKAIEAGYNEFFSTA